MRPVLLSTHVDFNGLLSDPQFKIDHMAVAPVSNHTVAWLLTDALGLWCYECLQRGGEEWRMLLSLGSNEEFRDLVVVERAEKRMRLDDTTRFFASRFGNRRRQLWILLAKHW